MKKNTDQENEQWQMKIHTHERCHLMNIHLCIIFIHICVSSVKHFVFLCFFFFSAFDIIDTYIDTFAVFVVVKVFGLNPWI